MERTSIVDTITTEVFTKIGREYCRTWVKMEDANIARDIPEALKYLHQARGMVEAVIALGYTENEFMEFYRANYTPWYTEDIKSWAAEKRRKLELAKQFATEA